VPAQQWVPALISDDFAPVPDQVAIHARSFHPMTEHFTFHYRSFHIL
jgi:hypothetical protein